MKKSLYIFLAALLFWGWLQVQAQTKMARELLIADYLYSHWSFAEAIDHYEKAADDSTDAQVLGKLGDCYFFNEQIEKAASCYDAAVKSENCPSAVRLRYADVLMMQGKYDAARRMLEAYAAFEPMDLAVQNKIKSCSYADSLMNTFPNGIAHLEDFNTDGFEFGPFMEKETLYFTSDSLGNEPNAKEDRWTGSAYYNMCMTALNAEGRVNSEPNGLKGNLNTKFHDGPCAFSADGQTMYFTRTNHLRHITYAPITDRNKNSVYNLKIMMASEYQEEKKRYRKVVPFPYNKVNSSTCHPTVSADGKTMVFASDVQGGWGGIDLYMTSLDARGKWTRPVNLGPAINTAGDEVFPTLSPDSVLYYSSNGRVGLGGLDIYRASWDDSLQGFTASVNMELPVNSSYDDMSFTSRGNEGLAYFASNRPAVKKNDNIYSYKPLVVYLKLTVRDAATKKILSECDVVLKGRGDNQSLSTATDGVAFSRVGPRENYEIAVTKFGYNKAELVVSTLGIMNSDTIEQTVDMKSNMKLSYSMVILNEKDKTPIENPCVVWMEKQGMVTDTLCLHTGETFYKELKPGSKYHVFALKTNYYSKEHYVSTKDLSTGGAGSIIDTLYMKKLEVGEVYKIDDIYYDYNKYTIREEARPALDQLINVLNQNPGMRIRINSHTDCRGTEAYNTKLSENRAKAVVDYLVGKGIAKERLQSKGFGESTPVSRCECQQCTEDQHQENRRTEFEINSL